MIESSLISDSKVIEGSKIVDMSVQSINDSFIKKAK